MPNYFAIILLLGLTVSLSDCRPSPDNAAEAGAASTAEVASKGRPGGRRPSGDKDVEGPPSPPAPEPAVGPPPPNAGLPVGNSATASGLSSATVNGGRGGSANATSLSQATASGNGNGSSSATSSAQSSASVTGGRRGGGTATAESSSNAIAVGK